MADDETGGPEPQSNAGEVRTVALWGASQVGKTTTLAAYLGQYKPWWIHRDHPDSRTTLRFFQGIWDNLQRNRLVAGTTASDEYKLRHLDGRTILFRDMQGKRSVSTWIHAGDADALTQADAAMVFLEWPGPRAADGRAAIENALQELRPDRPVALVITKCESFLTAGEFASFADDPLGFAQRHDVPADLLERLQSFVDHFRRGALFPVTVYGWNGSRPAHLYDEFGRLVPWYIRPAMVDRPFEHILSCLPVGEP